MQSEVGYGRLPVFTIGYGHRSVDEIISLIKANQVECLVDVRSAPYSKFKPEFSKEALETAVTEAGIRYQFLGQELGGRPDAPDCYVDGKVDYDAIRAKQFYVNGIQKLRRAHEQHIRFALMCSELRPEDCHRSKLIGVTLQELSIPLAHIDEEGVIRTQDEVISRLTGGQLDLFDGPAFTSRKRYSEEK